MTSVWNLALGLACVLSNLDAVGSTNTTVLEYLLNDRLTSWKKNVTQQIKVDVSQEVLKVLETETKKVSGHQIKIMLQKNAQRVANLEAEAILLHNMTVKWRNNDTNSCSSNFTTVVNFEESSQVMKLAIAEHRSGNVFLIDGDGEYRWTETSSEGILGMAYHPVNKMLYLVTAYRTSGIHSLNVYSHHQNMLRRCGRCIAINLDAKENILYFIQKSLKTGNSYVLRLNLNPTAINKKPLLKYSRNMSPSTLAVDDINKYVFVVLRGKGVIEQVDYTGKKVGEIFVDPVIEDRSITFNMALNKPDKVLYYNVDDELWRKSLDSDDDPEFLDVSDLPRQSGLSFVNNQLLVGYMNNSRIDVWTEEGGFHKFLDLGITGKSGSKHICLFD